MHVPRNPALPSPTFEEVWESGLLQGSQAAIVHAHPGEAPRAVKSAPCGFLFAQNEGLVFLATGASDSVAREVASELTRSAASQVVPIGGLLVSFIGMVRDTARTARELPEQLDRALTHADSFAISFVDLVETARETTGAFWTGRITYARLTREQADGIRTRFWITPLDEESVDGFMLLRLAAEERAVAHIFLREQVDVDAVRSAVWEDLVARYGEAAGDHLDQGGKAMVAQFEQQLRAKGLSFEELDRRAMTHLDHFRGHSEFAKYFPS